MSDSGVIPPGEATPQGDSDAERRTPTPGSEEELAGILSDFEAEVRQGHRPSVSVWARRYPAHSDSIQRLFPGVLLMEHTGQELPHERAGGPLPERIGPYPIVRELGRGGMGVVYLAHDERLSRQVALKVFQKYGATDQRFLERFFREARAAGRLNHPHIVPIFETGQEQGVPYYSMLYIEGPTLEQCLFELRRTPSSGATRKSGGSLRALWQRVEQPQPTASSTENPEPWDLSWLECSRLCREVGGALAHAHERGILHRDVKPANILLDRHGHAWVNDFGLCHWEGEAAMTEEGEIVGTLKYMAPEQLEGEPDERSDVYGLGLVLYELLTRKEAFPETRRARLVRQITSVDPLRPRKHEPAIPKDLETIVLKATAKLPAERYPSVQAFVRDLTAFEEGRAISARPPSTWYLALLLLKRHKLLAAVILFFVAASAVLTSLYLQSLRAEREQRTAGEYNARLTAAEAALHSAAVERGMEQLDLAPEAYRGWEWYHLRARMDQSVAQYSVGGSYARAVQYSPDGRLLAVASTRKGVILREEGSRFVVLREKQGSFNLVLWDAAAEAVYLVESGGQVWRMPLAAEEEIHPLGWAIRQATTAEWYDRERILIGNESGDVGIFDVQAGNWVLHYRMPGQVRVLLALPQQEWLAMDVLGNTLRAKLGTPAVQRGIVRGTMVKGGAWFPDAQEVIHANGDGNIEARSLDSEKRARSFTGGLPEPKALALSQSADRLAMVGMHRQLQQWVLSTGERLAPLRGHGSWVGSLSWSPQGDRLASGDDSGMIRTWHPRLRGGRMQLGDHFYDVTDIQFSSQTRRVLSSARDGSVTLWDMRRLVPLQTILGNGRPIHRSYFVRDAERVLSIATHGDMILWDPETGQRVQEQLGTHFPGEGPGVSCLHPDGQSVWLARSHGEEKGGTAWVRWSFADWAEVERGWLPRDHVMELTWDPTRSAYIAGTREGDLLVLDEQDWHVRERRSISQEGMPIRWVEVDPTTGALAAGDWSAKAYLLSDGFAGPMHTLSHSAEIIDHAQFIPGSSRIVGGTRHGRVSVWNTANGQHLCDIDTLPHWISHITCSQDGQQVIVGNSYGALWVYDHASTLDRLREVPEGKPGNPASVGEVVQTRLQAGRAIVEASLQRMQNRAPGSLGAAHLLSYAFSIRNEDVWEAGILHAAMDLLRAQPHEALAELRSIFARADEQDPLLQHARCLWVLAHLRLGQWHRLGRETLGVSPWDLWKWQRALGAQANR